MCFFHAVLAEPSKHKFVVPVRQRATNNGQKRWDRERRRRERQWEEAENGRRQNVYLNVFLIKCLLLLWKTILLFVKDKSKWKIEIIEAKVPCLPVSLSLSLSSSFCLFNPDQNFTYVLSCFSSLFFGGHFPQLITNAAEHTVKMYLYLVCVSVCVCVFYRYFFLYRLEQRADFFGISNCILKSCTHFAY